MSFSRLALRLATVKALTDTTLAGSRVRDSEIGPLEDLAENEAAPVIIVYTDDEETNISRRDLSTHDGWQSLVIELAVTTRMKHADGWEVPQTSEGLELTLDLIERQVITTLTGGSGSWAVVWRNLVRECGKRNSRRGASARDGTRYAGRQIVLEIQLPKEPSAVTVDGPLWSAFFAAVDAESDLSPISSTLRGIAVGDTGLTDFNALRAAFGMTEGEGEALLLRPIAASIAPPVVELNANHHDFDPLP